MKKKITIILTIIVVIGLLIALIFAMKKSDNEILQSEKSYLEMLVRNQKLDQVDKVLKRIKTKDKRYHYINNIKEIQKEISRATSKYFINYKIISAGKTEQEGLKSLIEREISKVDEVKERYKTLNQKDEMLKYAKQQGLSEEDEKTYYKMVGGDNEIKDDDYVIKKLGSTKENFKMQGNIINYLIQESGNYTINEVSHTVEFKDKEKQEAYKNLTTALEYNINEIFINNKQISNLMDSLKKMQTNTVK